MATLTLVGRSRIVEAEVNNFCVQEAKKDGALPTCRYGNQKGSLKGRERKEKHPGWTGVLKREKILGGEEGGSEEQEEGAGGCQLNSKLGATGTELRRSTKSEGRGSRPALR